MSGAVLNRYGRLSGAGHSCSVPHARVSGPNGPAGGQVRGR